MFDKKLDKRLIVGATLLVLALILLPFTLGHNNLGYYVVVQNISGRTWVRTSPGFYFKWFGKTTKYRSADTLYFSKWADESRKEDSSIDVRFTDGGTGSISVNVRYSLPAEPDKILLLHKTFQNDRAFKLGAIEQLSMQAAQTTASMMTAEDSYRNRRPQFISMIMDQITNGLYETKTATISIDNERIITQEILQDGNGKYIRKPRDLDDYGVTITQVNVTDIDYEKSVVEQIDRKREASMGAELAKVEAEKARQATIQAEEEGKRNVTVAKYQEEENKIKEITIAEKEKAIAEIAKQKAQVEVDTAKLVREATVAKAEGEAEARKLILSADGALEQKLDALIEINRVWADAYTKQRPTPDIIVGGGESNNSAQTFMDVIMMKAIKDLSLDVSIKD